MFEDSNLRNAWINAYIMYSYARLKFPISASKSSASTSNFLGRYNGSPINGFVKRKPVPTTRAFSGIQESTFESTFATIGLYSLDSFVAACNNFFQPSDVNNHYSTLCYFWQVFRCFHTGNEHLNWLRCVIETLDKLAITSLDVTGLAERKSVNNR